MRVFLGLLCGIVLLVGSQGSRAMAQFPETPSPQELRRRLDLVLKRIGKNVALVPSAQKNPDYDEFRQSNRFFWLTGLETPDAYLLLNGATKKVTLLLAKQERGAAWEGLSHPGPEKVRQQTGVDQVALDSERLAEHVDRLVKGKSRLFLPLAPEEIGMRINDSMVPFLAAKKPSVMPLDGVLSREIWLKNQLLKRYRKLKVEDLSPFLREQRVVKSPYEINMMRRAAEISADSLVAVMRAAKPGVYEYALGAVMEYHSKRAGSQGHGYAAIVGSGQNSCLPHYWRKKKALVAGDMVVVDAGCSYGYYVADVTRSFPANGKFSRDQKIVYEAVLAAQLAAIKACRPGVRFVDLNRLARKTLAKYRLKKGGPTLDKYFIHGLGHHVGMAVHDPGGYFFRLQPGHVLTIEPGAYLKDLGLGVRIEDVVLVTQDGCEVLSKRVPKTVAEIEALMKER